MATSQNSRERERKKKREFLKLLCFSSTLQGEDGGPPFFLLLLLPETHFHLTSSLLFLGWKEKLAKGPSIHVAAVTWDWIFPPPHITEIFDVVVFLKICGFIWPGNSIKRKSLVQNTTLLSVGKNDMRYHFGVWWSFPPLAFLNIKFRLIRCGGGRLLIYFEKKKRRRERLEGTRRNAQTRCCFGTR